MKKIKLLLATTSMLSIFPALAIENRTLKDIVVISGLVTNTFAISNRDKFKACEQKWQIGYWDGKDENMHAQTLRLGFLRCEMQTADLLPWGMQFTALPMVTTSMWSADSGIYSHSNSDIALMPMGRFSLPLGAVILDASFGLGPALIAKSKFANKNKSTNFQFSDEMSLGISDLQQRIRLDFSYRHISNADIQMPNNGMNFVGFGLTYRLD
jgi:hypothetical protein